MRRRLGKKPAVIDYRVPLLATHKVTLPPPPPSSNWFGDCPSWGMLGNDAAGDCVEAAVLHMIYQQLCYTRGITTPPPTTADALALYSAVTGYVAGDEVTDQGTAVLGRDGVMSFWHLNGVAYGGPINGGMNRVSAFMRVSLANTTEWRQAISIFGSLLVGLNVPENLVAANPTPTVWSDSSGPSAGGHEILLVGYESTADGVLYDLVSWGQIYRATEAFLRATVDELVVAYDASFIGAYGLDPAGVGAETLLSDMAAFWWA